jgi:hypothetical protein
MSPCARVLSSTTICSQMTSNSSQLGISALFASASMAPLLRLFMLDPEREYYQRELQRLTSVHLRQLQRDLARLSSPAWSRAAAMATVPTTGLPRVIPPSPTCAASC